MRLTKVPTIWSSVKQIRKCKQIIDRIDRIRKFILNPVNLVKIAIIS